MSSSPRAGLQWPCRVAAIRPALAALMGLVTAGGLHPRREWLCRRLPVQEGLYRAAAS